MNIHFRCRTCQKRQVRRDVPRVNIEKRRCSRCGRTGTLRVDKWAQDRGWRNIICRCDQYPYPHSKNSHLCINNPRSPDNIARALESGDIGPEHMTEVYVPDDQLPF